MPIISTLLPSAPEELLAGQQTILMALDTLVDDKSLVVGITVGSLNGPTINDVALSQPGVLVLDRCRRHHQLNYPDGTVILAGVAQAGNAKQRVRHVLTQAPPHALVLLICANGKVYDAAFPALGIDLQALNVKPQ